MRGTVAARYARAAEGGGEKRARGQSSGVGAGHAEARRAVVLYTFAVGVG